MRLLNKLSKMQEDFKNVLVCVFKNGKTKKIIGCFLGSGVLTLFFWGCAEEDYPSASSTPGVSRCALDSWNGHSPSRVATDVDGAFYVLDDFSKVYRYVRDPARLCAFNLDREFASFGELSLPGFTDDIDFYGSFLYYDDGISLRRAGDDEWECSQVDKFFDVSSAGISSGYLHGPSLYRVTAAGCKSSGVEFPGSLRVQAVASDESRLATVESVTGEAETPTRLTVYSLSGDFSPIRNALSKVSDSDGYFCSATRLRFFNTGILLFDAECGKLGVFNRDGAWLQTLSLADLGVRSPKDMAVVGNEVYFLTETSFYLAYRLELAELLR